MNAHLKSNSTSVPSNPSSSIATHEASYAEVAAAPKSTNGLTPRSPRPVNEYHGDESNGKVQFVLTDLHPHIPDWTAASKRSSNLNFIAESVDAANAPRDLLKNIHGNSGMNSINGQRRVFRLYNLAFHHFDNELGSEILKNTVETADGFGIFELQERTLSLPNNHFIENKECGEVETLMKKSGGDTEGWRVLSGRERHTWPTGYMTWVMGIKGVNDFKRLESMARMF
ncbi:hypothetical protein DID88_007922 [Monilinia fructigena]|uniref:Uncharacterized protein n=1 Tax=Monilinia fructigena TaxID=38457 RepID=A0A395J4U6_9HELO|nr:hypothetical protein DID88_007922 [Monilinia fructigena]